MRQILLILVGLLAMLFGIVFVLQGLGLLRWPVTSIMIGNQVWVIRGAVLTVLGGTLVGGARLAPTRAERLRLRDVE